MSGRLLTTRLVPPVQRIRPPTARHFHRRTTSSVGGLLRTDTGAWTVRRRIWPTGYTPFSNAVAVRNASFVRAVPQLLFKLARLPALFAGITISGVAYMQYQATQVSNYAIDVLGRTRDTVTGVAGGLFGGAKDVADQTQRGWDMTKDSVEVPAWIQKIFRIHEEIGSEPAGGGGGEDPKGEPKQAKLGAGAVGGGTAAAYGFDKFSEEDPRSDEEAARDDQMMVLTKKMIEIRTLLQTVGQCNALTLPSIVVIGSQSSGKSSVLEAIVGHEFLPKGLNMVTRRPIELTLVNTPENQAEYGEFPTLGLGKITDFSHIQRTLTELNMAVPDSECVSDDPIQLTISSPYVPDLSLIDLPGYIQVVGQDQPLELKQKIADLCDQYIQPPNVILAISAADVDLANSTALRASRRVDPRGERTIGVVTKLDLVDAVRGASVLSDSKYPLRLGYVGVVSKVPPQTALWKKGSGNIAAAISKNEKAYFSSHPLEYGPGAGVHVGTATLRSKLMHVLEQTMAVSLQNTSDAIRQNLEEATYEFKVQYNDRPLSAESYLAESLDAFKHSFKDFTESFGRLQVGELLKAELDQKVLDLLAARYWNKPITDLLPPPSELDSLADLPKADPGSLYWHRKLDASTSSLTKLGIGRLATQVVANAIQAHIDRLISQSTFVNHPFARQAITDAAAGILNERFYSTSDQVENCIKPYKYEIDVEESEWVRGRKHAADVLKQELKAVDEATKRVEQEVGGKRKLRDVMAFIEKARKGEVQVEGDGGRGGGGFSSDLLAKGREATFLSLRHHLLSLRLTVLKSNQCASLKSKYQCPEIFLDVVASKLVSTSVLFLNVELLTEFYYNFPRELDERLGRKLAREDVERFAREDAKIRGHLDCVRRKELLELVVEKIEGLRVLEGRARGSGTRDVGRGTEKDRTGKKSRMREEGKKSSGSWGIF